MTKSRKALGGNYLVLTFEMLLKNTRKRAFIPLRKNATPFGLLLLSFKPKGHQFTVPTMDSDENPQPHQLQPQRIYFRSSVVKPTCVLSILILLLAISFSVITKTRQYKIYLPKPMIFFRPNHFRELLKIPHSSPRVKHDELTNPPYCLLWMAPFLSGGGYSSEAWSYILALNSYIQKQKNPFFKLSIVHHGDQVNFAFWEGLPLEMKTLVGELYQNECVHNQTIVVCHSEPGAWYPPLFQTVPCPLYAYGNFKSVIGRTMFETDRVNAAHVERCNKMDKVWVPSDFHVNTFRDSGVDSAKIVKVVQPVDLEFFDPLKVEPLDLASFGNLVLGSNESNLQRRFVFLSVFKWEYRKGWDVLLTSYLKEFSPLDNVALYILTNAYHSESDFSNRIVEFVVDSNLEKPIEDWSPIYLIDRHIPQVDMPRLYMAADAFVLPSRGEGWGRPIVEAMAMSRPVIATNWSGATEYLRDENSYPLPFEGMSEVKEGPFKGHLWAEPSVHKLRLLMRHVLTNQDEARSKGKQARLDMIRRFSPETVAEEIIHELEKTCEQFD